MQADDVSTSKIEQSCLPHLGQISILVSNADHQRKGWKAGKRLALWQETVNGSQICRSMGPRCHLPVLAWGQGATANTYV